METCIDTIMKYFSSDDTSESIRNISIQNMTHKNLLKFAYFIMNNNEHNKEIKRFDFVFLNANLKLNKILAFH